VSIADQGGGIAKEVLQAIFDPYFSTKQGGRKGHGAGATICHTVIQKHGGAIAVESELGVGTTFHVHLPRPGTRAGLRTHPYRPPSATRKNPRDG
jgi:signal transduction histidine kinase